MSEGTPPAVAGDAAVGTAPGLTPAAVEAVLADFRDWLRELQAAAGRGEAPAEAVDLHTLLAQFTALRHEVNLQTRAARAQQEQNAETLRRLGEALDSLGEFQDRADQAVPEAGDEAVRPLLKTLVDLADALALGRREMFKAEPAVRAALDRAAAAAPAAREPWWKRWRGGSHSVPAPAAAEEAARQVWSMLEALVTGYSMSVQRVERALRAHGLEPVEAAGRPFDPERMEVMDAVADSGRPPGEVLEEVRRGYLWRGRVFRYALVRVAKS